MVVDPCGRCARPVVARVALGSGCRRCALDNEKAGLSDTRRTERQRPRREGSLDSEGADGDLSGLELGLGVALDQVTQESEHLRGA